MEGNVNLILSQRGVCIHITVGDFIIPPFVNYVARGICSNLRKQANFMRGGGGVETCFCFSYQVNF